jgi:predicted ABC-class ATPase
MIRDRRMQALIAKDREPITPFIDKIRQLYADYGVSTVLVMGGSGDYFDVADTVIAMTDYQPTAVTEQAKAIAAEYATHRKAEGGASFGTLAKRFPQPMEPPSQERDRRPPKLKVREVDELVLGRESVDLSALEQLMEVNQVRAIGAAITTLQPQFDGNHTLSDRLIALQDKLDANDLDILTDYSQGDLAMFRRVDLAAAVNRMRSLQVKVKVKGDRG